MATDKYQLTVDGQSVQQSDDNAVYSEAALADDVVKADLLRLPPFATGAVARAIIPYRVWGSSGAMVMPNGASGSVLLMPFTEIIGSRTAVSITAGSPALNWSDVRSSKYVVSDDNVHLGHAVSFLPNTSGNPRWDLICVCVQVDQNNPQVYRNVRAPGTPASQAPTATQIVPSTTQTLSIVVQEGTPGASPTVPAPPADTVTLTGTFYIPIAAVLIPNAFGATTTVLPQWIQMVAPIAPISSVLGARVERAPNRLAAALASTSMQTWGASGARPPMALPCTRQGGIRLRFGFDATTATPLIANGAVLDDSVNWCNRDFIAKCSTWAGATQFAWQHGSVSGAVPNVSASVSLSQEGQSYVDDSLAQLGSAISAGVLFLATSANLSTLTAATAFGLYVDLATGSLRVWYVGTPGQLLVITLDATDSYDNL